MRRDQSRKTGNIGQGKKFVTGAGYAFPLKFFGEIPLRKRMYQRITYESVQIQI